MAERFDIVIYIFQTFQIVCNLVSLNLSGSSVQHDNYFTHPHVITKVVIHGQFPPLPKIKQIVHPKQKMF